MNNAWRTYSRPEDNGHEYVAERLDSPGELYSIGGYPVVFNLEQVRAIEGGQAPADVLAIGTTKAIPSTAPVPPAHAGKVEVEPPKKRGRKPNASSSHHTG